MHFVVFYKSVIGWVFDSICCPLPCYIPRENNVYNILSPSPADVTVFSVAPPDSKYVFNSSSASHDT